MANTCALDVVSSNSECGNKSGIRVAYWAKRTDVDWDSMATDNTKFDTTTKEILGYIMNTGGAFKKVSPNKKTSFYDFTYTNDTEIWLQNIKMDFLGKDNDRKNKFDNSTACCDMVVHVYGTDGTQRVVGIQWNGTDFEEQTEPFKVTQILDTSGQRGSSKAR